MFYYSLNLTHRKNHLYVHSQNLVMLLKQKIKSVISDFAFLLTSNRTHGVIQM